MVGSGALSVNDAIKEMEEAEKKKKHEVSGVQTPEKKDELTSGKTPEKKAPAPKDATDTTAPPPRAAYSKSDVIEDMTKGKDTDKNTSTPTPTAKETDGDPGNAPHASGASTELNDLVQ